MIIRFGAYGQGRICCPLLRMLPAAYYLKKCSGILMDGQMGIVHNISSLTHRHPISLIGCGIYVNVALKILSGSLPLKEGIIQGMEEAFQYYTSKKWEDTIQKNYPLYFIISKQIYLP